MIAALLLAFGVLASAQQPGPIPVAFRDFSGGYVDNVDPVNLKPNESPSMLNVSIDDPVGSLKPRKGFARCGNLPSGNTPTALYEYTKSDGTRRLIASDNANVYSTPDCTTWTTIGTTANGFSASAQVYFKTVRDTLWIVNGSTWPHTWDGTTLAILDGRANTPTPTIPKCAFVEFWKERVWCGAALGDVSGVAYSALTDTNGNDLDPSTGTLAWPAANNFQIDQNAGSRLYGLKAYRNRLYAFKDNGIWEIGFDNDFSNFVRKTYASVGSRYQTSITEVDGVLYFTGRDGIYAFDGDNAVRISEKIANKFLALNQPLISQNYKVWTTETDFAAGTVASTTRTATSGSIVLSTQTHSATNGDFETGDATNWTYVAGTPPANYTGSNTAGTVSNSSIQGSYAGNLHGPSCFQFSGTCSAAATPQYSILDAAGTILLGPTSISATSTPTQIKVNLAGLASSQVRVKFELTGPGPTATQTSTFQTYNDQLTFYYKTTDSGSCLSNCSVKNSNRDFIFDVVQSTSYAASGTWTSEVYNAVSVSTWGAFSATAVDNSGSISYQVKVGSDTGAVAARPWVSVTPGGIISGTTDQIYVQVRATLNASSDLEGSPRLDDAQIAWNSGGNNTQKIYAYGWHNSLWVSASSGTATTNNTVMQRARAPLDAWMLHGLNIGPMTTYNDYFYAGASTHSAIYRMDYGTNDDGAAIPWYWESKDENWGAPNNAKILRELNLDYRANSSCNIRAGYVENQNTTYCVGNFPSPNALLSYGAGSRRLFFNGNPAYTYRVKVCDDTKDQSPTIIGVTPYATGIQRRGD